MRGTDFLFGDNSAWCNNRTRFALMRAMVLRCWRSNDLFYRSTSLRATLQRLLPGEVVISKSKTSFGPRHDCSYVQCGTQKPTSLTPLCCNGLLILLFLNMAFYLPWLQVGLQEETSPVQFATIFESIFSPQECLSLSSSRFLYEEEDGF